jgi:hypothetical protein
MLLEPEPHIPDIPDVSIIPEDVDVADDIDVPLPDDVEAPGMGIVPGSTAAEGAMAPGAVPPPSYMAVDPYISEGEVATVEHAVPLLVVGIAIVPAKPVGAGLTPADVISVAPSGIPVGELVEPIVMPSGEVAPIMGVGTTVWSTCAMAMLPAKTAGKNTAASEMFTGISLATISPGARLSDIGQFLVFPVVNVGRVKLGRLGCEGALPISTANDRCPWLVWLTESMSNT